MQIKEAKVVYVPIKREKDGEEKITFLRTGIRVNVSGTVVFHSFRTGSFSVTPAPFIETDHLGRPVTDNDGNPVYKPASDGKTSGLTEEQFGRTYGEKFVALVKLGMCEALAEEQAKRAA